MSSYSQDNDFSDILARLLANVDDNLDKREGSIIYDALAPAAAELAQAYIALDVYTNQTYLLNASGDNLDNRVVDYGLSRIQATAAQAELIVLDSTNTLMEIPIGTRFAVPNEYGGYNFEVITKVSTGNYIAQCETLGSAGNSYIGQLLPLQSINNLGSAAISSIKKPGEDIESDSSLRARAIEKINQESFAGNKEAYRQMCIEMDGVEDCKVFPAYPNGGYVELALIASNHTIPTQSFIDNIQEKIDPPLKLGYTCIGNETGTYHFSYNTINYQFTMPTISAGDELIFNTLKLKLYKGTTEITTTTGTSGTELTFTALNESQGTGVGLAPIGHYVTVIAPTEQTISISAEIELEIGYSIPDVQSSVNTQVGDYIYQVQNYFATKNTLTIYLSKISAAILNVIGIKSVDLSSLTINGENEDYVITLTGANVKYAILNSSGVTLSESN